jgi:hypothetical protein
MPIDETQWIAQLQHYLDNSETLPTTAIGIPAAVQEENTRLLVSRIRPDFSSSGLTHAAIQPINSGTTATAKPITAIATQPVTGVSPVINLAVKEQFRAGMVDRSVISAIKPDVFQRSPLAIKTKPEWTIAARQVYYQVPPVPSLSEPVRVGNFWLWPDPEIDYVDWDMPEEMFQNLPQREIYVKPAPDKLLHLERINTFERPNTFERANALNPSINRIRFLESARIRAARIPVRRVFFASTVPWRSEFNLTVRQEQRHSSTQITGGIALLTVSVYSQAEVQSLEQQRQEWSNALADAGYGNHFWKFLPVNLRNLQAFLDLEASHQSGPIKASINTDAGTATFLIQLSALGTQVWQQALEQRQAERISGICRFSANYYTRLSDRIQMQRQVISTTLADLIGNCGPESIQILNPTVSMKTEILVQGSPILETVNVDWLPNQGGEPMSQTFSSPGGTFTGILTSNNLNTVEVAWQAQVKYKTAGWPTITQTGTLSANSPIEIVKPSSSDWIREYSLFTVFMSSPSQASVDPAEFDHLDVEVTFTFSTAAMQIPLVTTFKATHFAITNLPFPLAPGQFPSQVGLIVTTRSHSEAKVLSSVERLLSLEETLTNVKIYLNGSIEIFTNMDPKPESSLESEIFDLLTNLNAI